MARVLYISYTGVLQPLGQSQVLAYLKVLAGEHEIDLVSFERREDLARADAVSALRVQLESAGLRWHPLLYHRRPGGLATAYDLLVGLGKSLWLVLAHRIDIVHCRSYVPSVIGLVLKRMLGLRFLFDMRGFWVDERVDGGLWRRHSSLYRVGKWFERRFFRAADQLVSLTHSGVDEINRLPWLSSAVPPCEVIPTCTDLTQFRPLPRPESGESFVLGYLGSAGSWYLFDQVLEAFVELLKQQPRVKLLIVNRGEHPYIRERLRRHEVPAESVELRAVEFEEVPSAIAEMDAGVFLIKPVFSKRASAPTRLGEFLGCGRPCLGNAGVGDVETILDGEAVGVCVRDTEPEVVVEGLRKLMTLAGVPGIGERCVAAAERHFSLPDGVRRYDAIYRRLDPQLQVQERGA